jgi:hypothetical protein
MTAKRAFLYFGGAISFVVTVALSLHNFFSVPGGSLMVILSTYMFAGMGIFIGSRLDPMTVRTPSLILAALYAAWGIFMYFAIPQFVSQYREFTDQLPAITVAVLWPRPVVWMLISFIFAGVVLAKDKSMHSRYLNSVFFITLGCGLAFTVVALFLPLIREISRIGSQ